MITAVKVAPVNPPTQRSDKQLVKTGEERGFSRAHGLTRADCTGLYADHQQSKSYPCNEIVKPLHYRASRGPMTRRGVAGTFHKFLPHLFFGAVAWLYGMLWDAA